MMGMALSAYLLYAQETTPEKAEQLVASKKKSDMTYRQMMQRMGAAYTMIQTGVINQNKALVRLGTSLIEHHPAPKEKPWTIVKPKDRSAFKQTLLSYDKLLHQSAAAIEADLQNGNSDWSAVNQKVFELSNHCISCHAVWKNNLK
jgi:hypothetical protein